MNKMTNYLYSLWRKIKLYKHRIYIRSLVANGLKLGKNVTIATSASIDDEYCYLISIGDNCTISHHDRILSHDATTYKFTDCYTRIGKVEIKDNCYFGENVIILPGVTIGPNVLVAAGSVVNKDIPPNSCVAGVPARFYAKFDEFIANHNNKIKESRVFNFSEVYSHQNDYLRKEVIASVQGEDAYVQGYPGNFPTTFNHDGRLYSEKKANNNMVNDFSKIHPWIFSYFLGRARNAFASKSLGPKHIFLCICDHFEPLGGGVSENTGVKRLREWSEKYPEIAQKYKDSGGCLPKHTFFYPIEEYRPDHLDLLADLCRKGYGEAEVHLHHDNDTADDLRKAISDYKNILAEKHGLLSKDKASGEIKYGFVHGNWALDNSRPDGRWCGVNNELEILQQTGCYADFTMPSAPDSTQTTKINSIYYAIDDPQKPKSHNSGNDAKEGKGSQKGLLMVQGPLMLNWKNRKRGIFPRIDNGFIGFDNPVNLDRIKLWINAGIHIVDKPECVFIKLHTHGCQKLNMRYLLNGGLDNLFCLFSDFCKKQNYEFHFVTAREMVNVIKALEDGFAGPVEEMRNYKLVNVTSNKK